MLQVKVHTWPLLDPTQPELSAAAQVRAITVELTPSTETMINLKFTVNFVRMEPANLKHMQHKLASIKHAK